jgi:glucokinase
MEAFAGGWAIAMRAFESVRGMPVQGSTILKMAEGDLGRITAKAVAQASGIGDPMAVQIMNEAADALSAGIATLVNVLNPCLVILGGGIIDGMPEMVARIDKSVRLRALPAATERLVVRASGLGGDAGIIGAAALALRTLRP